MTPEPPRLLKVGCGSHWHPKWTNIDLASASPEVQQCDLRRGIPFGAESFDAVYHSHVLEHLAPRDGRALLRECWRVLRPGGVLRIAVPDLETIAKEYLGAVQRVEQGQDEAKADLHWMRLELLDQLTRVRSGGEMASYVRDPKTPNPDFIHSRLGEEYNLICHNSHRKAVKKKRGLLRKLGRECGRARIWIAKAAIYALTGRAGVRAWDDGIFRQSGEVHRWMYDRISLKELLVDVGFEQVIPRAADDSVIPDFGSYQLDVVQNMTRKPDSLFVEASKPAQAASSSARAA